MRSKCEPQRPHGWTAGGTSSRRRFMLCSPPVLTIKKYPSPPVPQRLTLEDNSNQQQRQPSLLLPPVAAAPNFSAHPRPTHSIVRDILSSVVTPSAGPAFSLCLLPWTRIPRHHSTRLNLLHLAPHQLYGAPALKWPDRLSGPVLGLFSRLCSGFNLVQASDL